jgi:glycosyltransferase involved in cell wall biosynthesis
MNFQETLIVVPVYNEWPHVMGILDELKALFPHIVVIEDGSSKRLLKEDLKSKNIEYICLPFNLGSWAAIQTGFKYALLKGYQYVVTFDGDGQHLPGEISGLLEMFDKGYDIVIGCCPERVGVLRKTCWFILKKLSGIKVQDVTSGFRAYNRKAFKRFAEFSQANIEYQDVGVLLLAHSFGLNIAEVSTPMRCRIGGKSKVFPNMTSIAKYFLITLVSILVKWK